MTGALCELNREGDTKLIWDTDNEAEVEAARNLFAQLKSKGHLAYSVDENGNQAEVIREFDENAAKIIMAPQLVGG